MLPLPPPALMGSFYPRQCCSGLEIFAKLAAVQELEPADPRRRGAGGATYLCGNWLRNRARIVLPT